MKKHPEIFSCLQQMNERWRWGGKTGTPFQEKKYRSRRAQLSLRCWGQGEAKRRVIWHLRQIHAESSHKKNTF